MSGKVIRFYFDYEAHRQLGPAEVAPKMRWMWENVVRKAAIIRVPLNAPAFHPFNPLLALRISSLPLPAQDKLTLVDALLRAVWVRGLHIAEPLVVEQVANEAGLDGASLGAQASQPECKAQLRKQTDQAIADGVFGVPTMTVANELFWGYDDLPFLQRFLDGADADRASWPTNQRRYIPRRPARERRSVTFGRRFSWPAFCRWRAARRSCARYAPRSFP